MDQPFCPYIQLHVLVHNLRSRTTCLFQQLHYFVRTQMIAAVFLKEDHQGNQHQYFVYLNQHLQILV